MQLFKHCCPSAAAPLLSLSLPPSLLVSLSFRILLLSCFPPVLLLYFALTALSLLNSASFFPHSLTTLSLSLPPSPALDMSEEAR